MTIKKIVRGLEVCLAEDESKGVDDLVAFLREKLQFDLPGLYCELLKLTAAPFDFEKECGVFVDPSRWDKIPEDGFLGIGTFYGFGRGIYSINRVIDNLKGRVPSGFLPFSSIQGGDHFCIKMDDQRFPVFVWDHEYELITNKPFLIFNSFDEFVDSWTEKENEVVTSFLDGKKVTGWLDF